MTQKSMEIKKHRPISVFAQKVYEELKKVPKGKVVTYGQLAKLCQKPGAARAVGNALHVNPYPDEVPCFKVVNSKGELAANFGFGGASEQERRLIADGIEVTDGRVDLSQCQWNQEK